MNRSKYTLSVLTAIIVLTAALQANKPPSNPDLHDATKGKSEPARFDLWDGLGGIATGYLLFSNALTLMNLPGTTGVMVRIHSDFSGLQSFTIGSIIGYAQSFYIREKWDRKRLGSAATVLSSIAGFKIIKAGLIGKDEITFRLHWPYEPYPDQNKTIYGLGDNTHLAGILLGQLLHKAKIVFIGPSNPDGKGSNGPQRNDNSNAIEFAQAIVPEPIRQQRAAQS